MVFVVTKNTINIGATIESRSSIGSKFLIQILNPSKFSRERDVFELTVRTK